MTNPSGGPQFSRRTILRAGAWSILGLAGLEAIAACSPSATDRPATSGAATTPAAGGTNTTPKTGGVFSVPHLGPIASIDPHNQYNVHVTGMVYNGLLVYKNDMTRQSEVEGDLADSWKQDNDTTYTFKLKPGVKWQNVPPLNGRALTGQDIKYSFERITKPNDPLKFYREIYPIASIEAIDDTTVKFTLKSAYAPFISFVALPFAVIVPKDLDDANNGQPLVNVAVGTGPFILKDFGSSTGGTLEKNPAYFKQGKPYLDQIKFLVLGDKTTIFNAFRTGNVDVTPQLLPHLITWPQVKQIEATMKDKATVQLAPSLLWQSVRYNLAKPPFNDVRVRRALSLAIDRSQLMSTNTDGHSQIIGPLPGAMGTWALSEDELKKNELYTPNITKAKQLLSEAGFPNGFKTEGFFSTTNGAGPNLDDGLLVKEQWAKIGVESTIRSVEGSTQWYAEMANGAFEWTIFSHSGYFDPDDYFSTYYRTGAVRNYGSIKDTKLDDMIDRQRVMTDETARKALINEIQRYLLDQIYFTYLYAQQFPIGVQNYVKNYQTNSIPFASHRHWDSLWLDK